MADVYEHNSNPHPGWSQQDLKILALQKASCIRPNPVDMKAANSLPPKYKNTQRLNTQRYRL